MAFTRESKEEKGFIRIEGTLSIYEVPELRSELISCFETQKEVVLDLGGITDCDVAGIQLIYAAQKTADRVGRQFRIEKASVQFLEALNNAGIHTEDFLDPLKAQIPCHNIRRRRQNGENHYDSG